METIVAALVNTLASCVWMQLLTGTATASPAAASYRTPGLLPSELDLIELQAGRMTFDDFTARMAARS